MKVVFYTVFTFGLMVFLQSCLKKDMEILPEETQSGKGMFSCMYDGKPLNIVGAKASYSQNVSSGFDILISAKPISQNTPEEIAIGFYNIDKPGIYTVKEFTNITASFPNTTYGYRGVSGTIEVTKLDTVNKIVSGTFNADLVYGNLSMIEGTPDKTKRKDSISIRAGRFDLPIKAWVN